METISLALSMLAAVIVSAVLVRAIPVAIPTPLVQIGLGAAIAAVSHREVQLDPQIFFLLFLLRAVLRSERLAAAAFVLALTVPLSLRGDFVALNILAGVAIYGLAAVVILRFGLLALAAGFCVAGFIGPPVSLHTGAWYFGNILLLFGSAAALAGWAFHTSLGGARLWTQHLFR